MPKLGQVALIGGLSRGKVPIPPHQVGRFEVSGHLRAAAHVEWKGGKGRTTVSLDPSDHSVSLEHGPLSISDSGQLFRAASPWLTGQRIIGEKPGQYRHVLRHPISVNLALGSAEHGGATHKVSIAFSVTKDGPSEAISVVASSTVVIKAPGDSKITLTFSLTSDLTATPTEKPKRKSLSRQPEPALSNDIEALLALFGAAGAAGAVLALLRRQRAGG